MSSQTSQSVSFSEFQRKLYVPFGHDFQNRKSTSFKHVSEVITNNTKYERCFNSPRGYKVTMVTGRKRFVSNVVEGRLYINRVN